MSTFRLLLVALLLLLIALPAAAVSLGQLDDFQDGTTQNWIHGGLSPVPPTNEGGGRMLIFLSKSLLEFKSTKE